MKSGEPAAGSPKGRKISAVELGKLALSKRWIDQHQLTECLRLQHEQRKDGEFVRLGELLVQKGFLKAEQVRTLLDELGKQIVRCSACGKQFNVRGNVASLPKCPDCGGTTQSTGDSGPIDADGTWFSDAVQSPMSRLVEREMQAKKKAKEAKKKALPQYSSYKERMVALQKRRRRRARLLFLIPLAVVVLLVVLLIPFVLKSAEQQHEGRLEKNHEAARIQLRTLASSQVTYSFEHQQQYGLVRDVAIPLGESEQCGLVRDGNGKLMALQFEGEAVEVQADPDGDGHVADYFKEVWWEGGYRFEHFLPVKPGQRVEFYCIAEPVQYGQSGRESYFISHDNALRREADKRASAESPIFR